ncbi:carbohydrate esterase family 3 protein [Xylariaceae sp. FL0016]|nr:carbohydrate esterase family 3 protein [Xylariaceae sp. FL0016]
MLSNYKLIGVFVLALVLLVGFFFNSVDVEYHVNRLTKGHQVNYGAVAGGIPLRIMFLGASVARGEQSTGDRGFRKQLRDKLTSLGNPVNLVGFNRFGDWEDNDVEGWGAHRIRQLQEHAAQSVPVLQPNLVMIQVGSSDCFQRDDEINILHRMRELVDNILEGSPRATVIISTLVTTTNLDFEPCMKSANAMIRQVAHDLIREEKPVALAEMHYDQGLPHRPGPEDIVGDRMHPTDDGYFMMGDVFMGSIREVEEKGFLQAPANNGIADDGELSREVEERIREQAQSENPVPEKRRKRARA